MVPKNILIINHVFWPDKINTARLITELAEELVKNDWDVTALVCNRSYVDFKKKYTPKYDNFKGINIIRAWHPYLNQKNFPLRLLTSFIMMFIWLFHLLRLPKYDIILIGTNPPLSYFMLPFIKMIQSKAKLVMWAHDLYPEAVLHFWGYVGKIIGSLIKPVTGFCLRKLDALVDIGPCMRDRYKQYKIKSIQLSLAPWSFVEPKNIEPHDNEVRKKLFNDAQLAILYSGTLGKVHEYENYLALARILRNRKASVSFCFAGFGNKFDEFKKSITVEDSNISIADFVVKDNDLEKRLLSADFHLVSLKPDWTGVSLPSKFFGAIATGRPIIFSGSTNSAISKWINEYNIGFTITKDNIEELANTLIKIANNRKELKRLQINAHKTYLKFFTKKQTCASFNSLFTRLIGDN